MIVLIIVLTDLIMIAGANMDVMKEFSFTFGTKMFECGEDAKYTQDMANDIYNFWNKDHPLVHQQTGCLVVCALRRLEIIDKDGGIIEPNAEAYGRSTGAGIGYIYKFLRALSDDDDTVKYLMDLYKNCHRRTSTIANRCLAALEVSKCFRDHVHRRGWTPDVTSLFDIPYERF